MDNKSGKKRNMNELLGQKKPYILKNVDNLT